MHLHRAFAHKSAIQFWFSVYTKQQRESIQDNVAICLHVIVNYRYVSYTDPIPNSQSPINEGQLFQLVIVQKVMLTACVTFRIRKIESFAPQRCVSNAKFSVSTAW